MPITGLQSQGYGNCHLKDEKIEVQPKSQSWSVPEPGWPARLDTNLALR